MEAAFSLVLADAHAGDGRDAGSLGRVALPRRGRREPLAVHCGDFLFIDVDETGALSIALYGVLSRYSKHHSS